MTHDEKNVLYWLLGAARFGYLDLAQVAAWAGSDISTEYIAEVVVKLWEAQKKMTEQEDEEYDDPALDPDNDYCSCGRLTDNYPVICDHCRYMARIP